MADDAPLLLTLRDGTRVEVRPITPEDRWRLTEGLKLLSEQSRFRRFHSPMPRFSEAQLDYLTLVDGVDHAAWVAVDPDRPEEPGYGVARYVRVADEPEVAEAAITVVDHAQGRGLGTQLLGVLAEVARSNGIATFRNYVLAENTPMLELFDSLGATRELEAPGLYRVDLQVPAADDPLPDTPAGQAFAAAARRDLRLGRTTPPVWLRDETGELELARLQEWLAARQPDEG
jgi:ribosomal protein S18 acetylase RimI-like enzyme